MAVSRELYTYPSSYVDALMELLALVSKQNPHFGHHELRLIAQDFRNAEQAIIADVEKAPLNVGKFKHDKLSRYASFYDNFFIKYFSIPPMAGTNPSVTHVLLERVVRQNSGAYNAKFLKDLPEIDI